MAQPSGFPSQVLFLLPTGWVKSYHKWGLWFLQCRVREQLNQTPHTRDAAHTSETAYSSVAVTPVPDFWCSPVFHSWRLPGSHSSLFRAPPGFGEAALFQSRMPFTHTDFLLPPSHYVSLHKATNRQLVVVSMSKNRGLFFRGGLFGFFWYVFWQKTESIWSMAEGRGGPILKEFQKRRED